MCDYSLVEGTWISVIKIFRSHTRSGEFLRHCVMSGGSQRSALVTLPERGKENIKYFIPRSGNRTNNRGVYSHLCHDDLFYYYIVKN